MPRRTKASAFARRLTPQGFRDTRLDLGLSQTAFAALCGVDARTVRRWEHGQVPIPGPAARLMQALQLAPSLIHAMRDAPDAWDGLPPDPSEDGTYMLATSFGHACLGQWYADERTWHVRGFATPEQLETLRFRYIGPSPSPDIEDLYPAPPTRKRKKWRG